MLQFNARRLKSEIEMHEYFSTTQNMFNFHFQTIQEVRTARLNLSAKDEHVCLPRERPSAAAFAIGIHLDIETLWEYRAFQKKSYCAFHHPIHSKNDFFQISFSVQVSVDRP
jgi:hypothetical protein